MKTEKRPSKDMIKKKKDLTSEIKKKYKEIPKINNKISKLVKYFNEALTKHSIKRENYWGGGFTGNNIYKFLKNVEAIYESFNESIKTTYADFPLKSRMKSYVTIFQKFRLVYEAVNHSKEVDDKFCDEAQVKIDDFMDYYHNEFKWTSTPNKCHYLQERVVNQMRLRKVGLAQFSEQGMEAGNQSRKASRKRTKSMNELVGLLTDARRLLQDKSLVNAEATTLKPSISDTHKRKTAIKTSQPESSSSRGHDNFIINTVAISAKNVETSKILKC